MPNLLHRLKQKFLSRNSKPTTAIEKKISEYPLSDPKPPRVLKVRVRRRKFVIQPPSTDPRFNHAIRRQQRAYPLPDGQRNKGMG